MRLCFEASSIIQRIETYPIKKWHATAQTYVYLLTFQPKSVILYLIKSEYREGSRERSRAALSCRDNAGCGEPAEDEHTARQASELSDERH